MTLKMSLAKKSSRSETYLLMLRFPNLFEIKLNWLRMFRLFNLFDINFLSHSIIIAPWSVIFDAKLVSIIREVRLFITDPSSVLNRIRTVFIWRLISFSKKEVINNKQVNKNIKNEKVYIVKPICFYSDSSSRTLN